MQLRRACGIVGVAAGTAALHEFAVLRRRVRFVTRRICAQSCPDESTRPGHSSRLQIEPLPPSLRGLFMRGGRRCGAGNQKKEVRWLVLSPSSCCLYTVCIARSINGVRVIRRYRFHRGDRPVV